MRITMLTPGTGHFLCGSCLRDNALALALRERGHDAYVVPLYLPLFLEDESAAPDDARIRMGGINMYLQHKLPLMRFMPRFLADQLDRPGLLRWAAAKGDMTDAAALGDLTLSMLRGEEGRQAAEVEKLIAWLVTQETPDVICISNVMLTGIVRRLKAALGVPVVCSMQGEAPFLDALSPPYRELAWTTLAERARDVDAFVAVSGWYGNMMRERLNLPEDRVHLVYNGIDTREFLENGAVPPDRPTIGYLARMCADKGLPTLVDAFIRLKERPIGANARLRVAGVMLDVDKPVVAAAKAQLAEAGVLSSAEFLPNVSRPEKLAFLRSLTVLSVPATYGESFGLYLLEALASGVPVAQPRHAAFPEILAATGGGLLCEPDDPASLADLLERMLTDESGTRAMGERGRAAVLEHFHVDRMAQEVEDVLTMVTQE